MCDRRIVVLTLLLLPVAGARAQDSALIVTNENLEEAATRPLDAGGKALLPPGFLDLWWGAPLATAILLRGPLEEQYDGRFADLRHFWEELPEGMGPERVRYTFYRDELLAFELWFPEDFDGQVPRQVVSRMVANWGPVAETVKGRGDHEFTPVRWHWRDPHTQLTLLWNPETGSFKQRRRSALLYARMEADRRAAFDDERDRRLDVLTGEF